MESALGLIPKGWEVGQASNLLELAYGKGLPQGQRVQGPYSVFGSSGEIGRHKEYLVDGPGIIVGRKGTIGHLSWARDNFWPIDTTYYVVPKRDAYSLEYLYHVLAELGLEERNNDSAVPGLNRNEVYALNVIIPPAHVIEQYNHYVKPWFNTIHTSNQESAKLTEIRDYLLPKLLSGVIPVEAAGAMSGQA